MSSCEKCWRDSRLFENYAELSKERKETPCTPEEHAGPDAEWCKECGNKTVHQCTHECIICSGERAKV